MPMNKSRGNMYPWVTHTWNPIRGRCAHQCSYCYIARTPSLAKAWEQHAQLVDKELKTNLGKGNFIFVGSSTDMFSDAVPVDDLLAVLMYCAKFDNSYLFQTKNVARMHALERFAPADSVFCTTIETNRELIVKAISNAPPIIDRALHLGAISHTGRTVCITMEPILDFDLGPMLHLVRMIDPTWVSIGADSKGCGLNEPEPGKIHELIDELKRSGISVKEKKNLRRILNG